ncbi:MAG: DUF4293 domain-containing protein [Prevotella sp.]|jgi:hypothetical protein|nr:DUF4293 domain-containing protein [Prevotella sp.]
MIQRIQSIFLLLAGALMGVTVFSPLLTLSDSTGLLTDFYSLGTGKLFDVQYPAWGVVFIAVLGALAALINIFLYKNRNLQIKAGILTSLLILFFYVTVYVYFGSYTGKYNLSFTGIRYGMALPFIALIFNVLAVLRIKKDEKLVKSLDRIR